MAVSIKFAVCARECPARGASALPASLGTTLRVEHPLAEGLSLSAGPESSRGASTLGASALIIPEETTTAVTRERRDPRYKYKSALETCKSRIGCIHTQYTISAPTARTAHGATTSAGHGRAQPVSQIDTIQTPLPQTQAPAAVMPQGRKCALGGHVSVPTLYILHTTRRCDLSRSPRTKLPHMQVAHRRTKCESVVDTHSSVRGLTADLNCHCSRRKGGVASTSKRSNGKFATETP